MRQITKVLAIGAFIVAVGGMGLVANAQTTGAAAPHASQGCGGGMMGGHGGHHAFGFGDPAARLATLKADLKIKPEQTAAWDAYAKVVQDTAQQMQAARGGVDRDAVHAMYPQDREAVMTKMRVQHEQALATVKTAAQTLLPSLDDAQKTTAQNELPGLAAHGPHMKHHAGIGIKNGSAPAATH